MVPFVGIFCVAMLINVGLTFRSSSYWNQFKIYMGYESPIAVEEESENLVLSENKNSDNTNEKAGAYKNLLVRYLIVYMLAALSDWLQGPYVYQLYSKYDFSQHDIAVLFVAGFGSSMVFGSFIGGLADSCGRKKFATLFAVIYGLSCCTKHFKDYNILLMGRILGGIATSLLFSVFDSWLIKAHATAGLSSYLSKSFSWMQYANSSVAIFSGLLANKAANLSDLRPYDKDSKSHLGSLFHVGGLVNPFDIALLSLILCGLAATFLWEENYGSPQEISSSNEVNKKQQSGLQSFQSAYNTIMRKTELVYCGLICSLFEGSMYIFVFMWTPSMKSLTELAGGDSSALPFGFIFSTFMVFSMAGSSLFSIMVEQQSVEKLGIQVFGVATVAFALMAISQNDFFTFLAFNLFEMCVGMYFPIMGTMKSSIVPEDQRAAIYNIFRIPLNVIVLFSLLTDMTPSQSFSLCVIMMGAAVYLMHQIMKIQACKSEPKEEGIENDPEMPVESIEEISAVDPDTLLSPDTDKTD
mmetsp:Transcript_2270/g.2093  ORF Transcript_2270/g.2093 Transcript_2270/m.2093 type:complete len:525 (-) Transcript_2270:52-1626(-)